MMRQVEKWGMFECAVQGRVSGNPFRECGVYGTFEGAQEHVRVQGFYDGDNTYRVRFMPGHEGHYSYTIQGSALDGTVRGEFEVTSPGKGNHGPVRASEHALLSYADGTPCWSVGTTCYAWVHQSMELQEQTLKTLAASPFNKIRFCFFPKFYEFNTREPLTCPFERGHGEGLDPKLLDILKNRPRWPGEQETVIDCAFDYTRLNVEHFRRFDLRIRQLMELGIEADLILMHPYDRWGINAMDAESCDAYLRYVTARYGAFRNVWWSLSNEYDFIPTKTEEDWERYGQLINAHDPYRHMCSIHNGMRLFDYARPWITHLSLQRTDFYRTTEETDALMEKYHKPVVWDEICYEGNISLGWGNISGQELVRRFWEAFLRGGYAGHGETFLDKHDILWWSHGGVLKGESAPRLAFLKRIMEETPGRGMERTRGMFDEVTGCAIDAPEDYRIHYLGLCRPMYRLLFLTESEDWTVDVIDTWNMTVTPVGIFRGMTRIDLPGREYMALRVRRVKEDARTSQEDRT